jgi:hypothetical protein
MVRRLAWLPRADYLRTATTTTLRADQEPCQNGLVEDHSGGYRIEPRATPLPCLTQPSRAPRPGVCGAQQRPQNEQGGQNREGVTKVWRKRLVQNGPRRPKDSNLVVLVFSQFPNHQSP